MRTHHGLDVVAVAADLDATTIHVWLLDYRRERRRQPLHALLGAYLGLAAEDVVLREGEHGRPELTAPWDGLLQFNWSHSGNKAIVAITRGVVPGIDIERIRPRPRTLQVAERFFHPDETAALSALDDAQRERAFLQLWTGKEAVLKAMGRGLAFGLDRLRLSVAPASPRLLWLDGDDAACWQLHRLDVALDYVATLAWRGASRTVGVWTLADDG